jgi:hypothetical protein
MAQDDDLRQHRGFVAGLAAQNLHEPEHDQVQQANHRTDNRDTNRELRVRARGTNSGTAQPASSHELTASADGKIAMSYGLRVSPTTLAAYVRRFAVALTVGGLFAAGGSWLAWRSVTTLPTDGQMRAIVGVLYPGEGKDVPLHRYDVPTITRYPQAIRPDREIFGTPDGIVPGFVEADLGQRDTDLAAAARALADDGWRVGEPDGSKVTAARDGWRLVLDEGGFVDGNHNFPESNLRVERRPTVVAVIVSVLAWLVGGAFGWFKPDRLTIGFVGPALLAFNSVFAAVVVIGGVVTAFGAGTFRAPWETFEVMFLRPASVLGVAVAADPLNHVG